MKWLINLFRKDKPKIEKHYGLITVENGRVVGREITEAEFLQATLTHQLNTAIESENYEEAARIRDLINKK